MKRRNFIKNTSLGVIGSYYAPLFLSGKDIFGINQNGKKLIVIQLSGGNDGLNTVVPYENDLYYNARPVIGIPKKEVIKGDDQLGFNPAMKSFSQLFEEGYVSVLNSVGYPNPNRSHFRSMDIWQTASESKEYLKNGWIGRYLDAYCQNSYAALEIDSQLSLSMQGSDLNGLALKNSGALYRSLQANKVHELAIKSTSSDLDEDNLGYLYKTLIDTYQSAGYIKEAHRIKNHNYDFPKTKLGRKLGTVSQFVRSGLNTEIYYVSHNGFDSHANQLNQQKRLLKEYSDAVFALVKSLEKSGHMDDVMIMTFSEFGRRVKENASQGTDHGKANNLFIIGKKLKKPGFYNQGTDLKNLDDGDLKYEIDFRNVFADIIKNWLGKDPKRIISTSFGELGFV